MRGHFFFLLSFVILIFIPHGVSADDKFSLTANLKYEIHTDGNTIVTQEFNLTNNSPDFYVKQYQVNIGDSEIYNLHAFDDLGLLPLNQLKNDRQLIAQVFFRQPVLGLGQTYHWSITYETPSLSRKVGRLWQINIPKPSLSSDPIPFKINLVAPTSFGPPVYTIPYTENLIWTDQPPSNIYTAVFDPNPDKVPYQTYNFQLKYKLYNSRLYPVIDEVPLPPDTEYQKIFLYYLNPRPQDVILDEDGNWLARYYLGPAGRLDVEASGSAALQLNPSLKPVSVFSNATNTEQRNFWLKDDRLIQIKSQQLGSTEAIFKYVVSRINLTGQPKKRQGGKAVFLSSQATNSLDLADVFVTMNRSINIPTKEVTGFVWQDNRLVLQSWVEFYNSESHVWQMTDPLEAKLKPSQNLNSWDLNHLTLVILGKDSRSPDLPLAPNDVSITPEAKDLIFDQLPKISYHANVPDLATAGFNIDASAFLENLGPTLTSGETINLSAENIRVTKTSINSGPLPPFAERQIDLPIEPTSLISDTNAIIKLEIDGHTDSFPINIQPFYRSKFIIVIGGLTLAGLIAIATQITRSLLLQKRRRRNDLRRESK